MIGWVRRLFRRVDKRQVAELARDALALLLEHRNHFSLKEVEIDRAADVAVRAVASRLGVDVDATEVRLAIAEVILARTHRARLDEDLRHARAMAEIEARHGK